jgi:hypothetical protein
MLCGHFCLKEGSDVPKTGVIHVVNEAIHADEAVQPRSEPLEDRNIYPKVREGLTAKGSQKGRFVRFLWCGCSDFLA